MNMMRRLLSAARKCKRAVRNTILRCPFLKRNKKGGDETSAVEEVIDSREAVENQTNPSSTVSVIHCEVAQTSAAAVCEEIPKEGKRAKRTRRNKGKSGEDKLLPVEIMAEKKPDKLAKKSEKSEKIIIHDAKTTEKKKAMGVLRKQCKSKLDSLLPSTDEISQKTENVLNADKARRITKTAVDSSTLGPSSVTKNKKEAPKSREIVMGAKQSRIAVEVSPNYERIDGTSRNQPLVISDDDVSRAKEQCAVVCMKTTETSIKTRLKGKNINRNCNGESIDTLNGSGDKQLAIAKHNSAEGDNKTAVKRKTVNFKQESNKKVELSKAEAAVRETDVVMTYAAVAKKRSQYMNEELNIKAESILNKISPRNAEKLTEKFKDLPINTIQCLDSITTIVFEKAIGKQSSAPLYAALCSAMQSVVMTCPVSKRTVTFKALILQKCQDVFKADKFYRTAGAANELADINSCSIPEKKVELRLAYEKKEKAMSNRSMGNCRFIGELFKERLVSSNIILYCITNLIDQRSDEPLECLCNLLKIVGEEFERCTSLKGTFKKLNALTSDRSVSARIKSMIRDVIDLRRNKWSRDVKTRKA